MNAVFARNAAEKVARKGAAALRVFGATSCQSSQQRQSSQGDCIGWSGGQGNTIAS